MDTVLNEVFEQASKLLAEVDRRAAEELDRRTAAERQAKLDVFCTEIEQAFDFSSREKIELNTRLDLHHGEPVLEFMVRTARAVFALRKTADKPHAWRLEVQEAEAAPCELGVLQGGMADRPAHEDGSRRIAAVRVVVAIGKWLAEHGAFDRQPEREPAPAFAHDLPERQAERRPEPEPEREPVIQQPNRDVSYGTFGKFMGY
jgi:hypothetical protein